MHLQVPVPTFLLQRVCTARSEIYNRFWRQVGDLIYYVELARGAYQKDAAGLARISMIQESNVVKFEDKSSVMRPGYYIAIDKRHKLVVLCIRGTHTIHDIITDLASHSEDAATLEGESVHYGSVEAARWFVQNELATLKGCLKQHAVHSATLKSCYTAPID